MISLIVPVYNTECYLERCIESIISQDYPNIEVILVNDGSEDNSKDIIQSYSKKYNNIICIEQENRGVGAARNTGMRNATGDYISFVDSDDVLYSDYCSYLMNIIGNADIAIAGRDKYINDAYFESNTASHIMTVDAIEAIKYSFSGTYNTRPAWGKLFKRKIVEDIFFVEGHIFEEIRYAIDTFSVAKKVVFADKDLYSYRIREGSIMTSNQERQIKDFTLSLEYVFKVLCRKHIYEDCKEEFKYNISTGIARNVNMFRKSNIDVELFKEYSGRLVDLYLKVGGEL